MSQIEIFQNVDMDFLKIAKAFDLVNLVEYKALVIYPTIFVKVASFMRNHSVRVTIEEDFSPELPVCSAFPQGSILGPVLSYKISACVHHFEVSLVRRRC